jgi:hypothetical protein
MSEACLSRISIARLSISEMKPFDFQLAGVDFYRRGARHGRRQLPNRQPVVSLALRLAPLSITPGLKT